MAKRLALDYAPIYTVERIGTTRSLTPEGFLLCENVPISRCGELLYAEHELQGSNIEGQAGIVRVTRMPEDVFAASAMTSFIGKPVIITHGPGEITPANWQDHAVGVILNPRRGEGDMADCLVVDLLITVQEAIDRIKEREGHELSAGYDADYEQLGPGRARQHAIIGNHVALIDRGRCGSRCSIGDQAMAVPRKKMPPPLPQGNAEALRKAFKTRDESGFEEALAAAQPDEEPDEEIGGAGGANHHITVNVHPPGGAFADASKDAEPGAEAVAEEAMPAWAKTLVARIEAIEASMKPPAKAEPEAPTSDKMTTDSASLSATFHDTLARAEILAPGIKLLTFDAKMPAAHTNDAMCGLRRQAITIAMRDADKVKLLGDLFAGQQVASLTCDAVAPLFLAASELVKAGNVRAAKSGFAPRMIDGNAAAKGPPTPAEINAANRKRYGYEG
jgi:hypothetical protein